MYNMLSQAIATLIDMLSYKTHEYVVYEKT